MSLNVFKFALLLVTNKMLLLFLDLKEEHDLSKQNPNPNTTFKIFNQNIEIATCLHFLTQMVSFTVFFLVIYRLAK